jgi:hypothetical protein
MSISLNPVFPVIDAKGAVPDTALQPGTVINARVIKVLDDNLVRIAIASLKINVLSEVTLQPGTLLKLAVSQTADGIRLAIVPPAIVPPATVSSATAPSVNGGNSSTAGLADSPLELSAIKDVSAIATAPSVGDLTPPILSPVEALAVAAAAQSAAARQAGLSPLFANVSAAVASDSLPEPLQQAAQQLLALRSDLTTGLSGDDVKAAFQKSGLFLESSLASGQSGAPDLKAALIVFRQTLSAWLGESESSGESIVAQLFGAQTTAQPRADASSNATAWLPAPDFEIEEVYLPKALLPVAEEFVSFDGAGELSASATPILSAAARAAATTTGLNILQDIARSTSSGILDAVAVAGGRSGALDVLQMLQPGEDVHVRTDVPPPPFRGATPEPQAVASPSIVPDGPQSDIVRHLVDDADGAIARQTLLQIASLPDRADVPGVRFDHAAPSWNFEIPFMTPRGTAVAQFEISRDGGGGKAVKSSSQAWRARFSLDVEPAGPVHAYVSLIGETTSVRMWAERPETVARLRDHASQLGHALRQAELEPGDIIIGNGLPPGAAAPAGHFLDRAT